METTEKIVNSYCNYVKGWATIPNIKCDKGQQEIDILAIDPLRRGEKSRYHIECSIHVSAPFSKITGKPYSPEKLKQRIQKPKQRMTIGFFIEKKFGSEQIIHKLKQYGFEEGKYTKVIVTMGWTEEAEQMAKQEGIILWGFNDILQELADKLEGSTRYYEDDTLRTIQLFLKSQKKRRE